MKKFLLSLAAMALAVSASAYTTTAVTSEYEPEEGDIFVALDNVLNVDVNLEKSSILIKGWMGTEGYDLTLYYDADGNVTKMLIVQPDDESEYEVGDGDGYVPTYTGNAQYYYMQFYFVDGYQEAYADETGGYVFLAAYAYENENDYDWVYYYIEFTNPDAPTSPEELYVIGNFPDNQWLLPATLKMEKDGDTFTADIELTDAGEGNGYFAFTSSDSEVWDEVNANRYGPVDGGDGAVVVGEATEFDKVNGTFFLPAGSYNVVVDFTDWTLLCTETEGGIEVATVDFNAPVEYFNLQGVRVDNPVRGQMVIARQGNAVSKYIVR